MMLSIVMPDGMNKVSASITKDCVGLEGGWPPQGEMKQREVEGKEVSRLTVEEHDRVHSPTCTLQRRCVTLEVRRIIRLSATQ